MPKKDKNIKNFGITKQAWNKAQKAIKQLVDKDEGEYGDDSVAALESLFAKVSKERQYAIALSDKQTMPMKELKTKAEYLEFITANNIMLPT